MRLSLDNILLFNMFGIPFTGADVCGFNKDVSVLTCAKWYKVAVIYPFARNHNNLGFEDQEPFIERFNITIDFKNNKTGHEVIRNAMLTRYGLHSYVYTQFHKASTDGIVPLKPLFFNYPDEAYSYEYVHNNILIGDAVKASPDTTTAGREYYYFPDKGEQWCPIWEGENTKCIQGGSRQISSIPINEVWLHLKSGHIITLQLSDANEFEHITGLNNLDDLQNYYTDLAVLLNSNNQAFGDVRFDDGESPDLSLYDEIKFSAQAEIPWVGKNKLEIIFDVTHQSRISEISNAHKLGEILIYNAKRLKFVFKSKGEITDRSGNVYPLTVTYDESMDQSRIKYISENPLDYTDIAKINLQSA